MRKKAADEVKFELEQETPFGPSFLVKDRRRKKSKPRERDYSKRKES